MDSPRPEQWSECRDVLCVRLDTIGDVLMTTPALRALREQRDGRRLTLLTSRAGALAGALVPEVDRVIAHDAPWMKTGDPPSAWRDCALVERLRASQFDAAVTFTTYSQSPLPAAMTCHLAGIPRQLAHCREKPYGLISDWVAEPEPELPTRHEVQRQLDLVATVGATTADTRLSLSIPPEATLAALSRLRAAGIDPEEPWLLLHPGTTAASRRYPAEHYVEAMRQLARETGRRVAISGTDNERPLVEEIAAGLAGIAAPLAGTLSFPELCGLIAAAPLLICGNTGPAHVAAAVGTPLVVPYALTNPQHTPWRARARVLTFDVPCRWCQSSVCRESHHDCLAKIAPLELAEAAFELLEEEAGPRAPGSALVERLPVAVGELRRRRRVLRRDRARGVSAARVGYGRRMDGEIATITPYRDGPLLVRGPVRLEDMQGREIAVGRETIALCRCGKSRIRPFCDGTHKLNRFRAPSEAENGRGD